MRFYMSFRLMALPLLLILSKLSASWTKPSPGCPEGLWGEKCQNRCESGCRSGCDKETGRCTDGCRPGWMGDNCESMCHSFTYGVRCKSSCGHCQDEKPCNIVTGRCSDGCMAGWRGEKCDEGCKPFTYGANCNSTCGHCRQNQPCNMVTGQCSSGCDSGWLGRMCNEAEISLTTCLEGYFGVDCRETCGHCAENTTCNHVTGICPFGCAPGWTGHSCNQACQAGRYGSDCRGICGRCLKGACDPVTGECNSGCSKGYQGAQCTEECSTGWYGENCSTACGHCLSGSGCDPVHGICPNGCLSGWHGPICTLSEFKTSQSFHSSPSFPALIICLIAAVAIVFTFVTYFVVVRPRKTALRRLYNASSVDHLPNTYEQIIGSPWEIQRGQLSTSNELLGNGQFGQVKKGHVKLNGMKVPVAIKSLKDNASEKDKTDFLNELAILKRVGKHENVVCLVGACHIRGVMYVAMEYAKHGDLRTFLRHSRRLTSLHEYDNTSSPSLHTALRPQALIKLSLDTARGLKHLADKQIIHRDVAARNVLLGDKLVAKIADFGLSKNDQTYVKTSSTRVPIRWMAVESLFNNTYTLQSDVWSFGVLLWEIFTLGGTPYSSIDSQQLFKYLKDGHRLRKPRLCDQDMYSMMLQCWHDDPDRRPTVDELTARLNRMMENSQVYMNLNVQEESLYTEIDIERMN